MYVANGCSYCHTQQVRPLDQDKVFGRPSAPGDFAYPTPELLGSERTGPDFTNIGERQSSAVWQYIHLYNPRAVVPESIMPAFDWLFHVVATAPAGATVVPLPKALRAALGRGCTQPQGRSTGSVLASLKQTPLSDSGHDSRPRECQARRRRPRTAAVDAAARGGRIRCGQGQGPVHRQLRRLSSGQR